MGDTLTEELTEIDWLIEGVTDVVPLWLGVFEADGVGLADAVEVVEGAMQGAVTGPRSRPPVQISPCTLR